MYNNGFVKFGNFPKLEVGMPVDSAFNQIHGGLLESAEAEAGSVLAYGAATGKYKVAESIESAKDIAGILAGDRAKLNLVFGEPSAHYVQGDAVNVLTQGYIAVAVDAVDGLKEGGQVYVVKATGHITSVDGTASTVAINAIFTGEHETINGVKVAGIKLL